MKLMFVIGPDFVHWPVALSREIKKRIPDSSFCSLVIAPHHPTYTMVKEQQEPPIFPSPVLDDLEQQWLETPHNVERLKFYETLLGLNSINECIIADRYLGSEYVSGGILYNTTLTRTSRSHDKQLSYMNGLLDFLYEFLQNQKPDLVLAPAVASAPTLALAKMCKVFNIKFRVLNATRFESYYVLDESPYLDSPHIKIMFDKYINDQSEIEDILPIAQGKLDAFRAKPSVPEYCSWYSSLAKMPKWNDTLSMIYRTLQNRKPEVLVYPLPWSRLFYEWRRYFIYMYNKIKTGYFAEWQDTKDKKYIYFPLHHDPECSTMVLAPFYTNQLDVIERLSKSLPVGMTLAVKEHIPMLGNRPNGFYKKIKSFPNVVLVSPFVSGFQMIQNAALTTVITGTAGFEALMLQKPTLCLGRIHYHALNKGYVYCDNPNELPLKINEALEAPPASDKEITTYLACLMKDGFDCKAEFLGIDVNTKMVESCQNFVTDLSTRIIQIAAHANV